jgi:hypothetical protein
VVGSRRKVLDLNDTFFWKTEAERVSLAAFSFD